LERSNVPTSQRSNALRPRLFEVLHEVADLPAALVGQVEQLVEFSPADVADIKRYVELRAEFA
jgi:hypothetical protein